MKLVIITGMPGAGKSVVANIFREHEYPVIVMGDVIREQARRRGLDPDSESTKKIMLELRELDGPGAVAKKCLAILQSQESNIVVIEGCRSLAEVDVFDDFATDLTIICVHSSPKTRFRRLQERGRKDAPPDWLVFKERDMREIAVGLGGVIAMADIMIVNEGPLETLRKKTIEILEGL